MAGEIFVGSVAVGVVPDLRGFNTAMRRELVPEANRVGNEIGREIARGIAASLDIGRTVRDAVVRDARAISEAGTNAGRLFAVGFKNKLSAELRGYSPRVTVEVHADTTAARLEIARLSGAVTEHVRVRRGLLGGIGGIGGAGLGGIAGAASAGAGGAASAFGNVSGAFSKLPPQAQIAAIGAAIAALPFIAQVAAGGIVTALGGALAAIPIIGAARNAEVAKTFTRLKERILEDFEVIGQSWVNVLISIGNTAKQAMDRLTPVFEHAAHIMAGPFRAFADTLINSFTQPAVVRSINDVAKAFSDILKALTPQLPGMIKGIAEGISAIAHAVSDNPRAFANFINFLANVIEWTLKVIAALTMVANWIEQHWDLLWNAFKRSVVQALGATGAVIMNIAPIIKSLVAVAIWVKDHWNQIWHTVAHDFDVFRHGVAAQWDLFWQDTIGRAIRGQRALQRLISDLLHNLAHYFDVFRHAVASVWDTMWNNTIGRAIRGWHDLMGVFERLKKDVISWFSGAVNWLANAGSNIIHGLLNGIRSAMAGIGGWVKRVVVDPVINAVKNFFGIHSDSTVMINIGRHLISGLLHGVLSSAKNFGPLINKAFGSWPMALGHAVERGLIAVTKLPAKAIHALASVAGKIGGTLARGFAPGAYGYGVERWLDIVKVALMLNNLPDSLAGRVLYQMRSESGGNPNAINLTDINAQRGDPSRGLMQVIGSTFAAYRIPGTSSNIYDPLANIAAAINYARHVYGPSLMSSGMGIGSGRGYDEGGWLPAGLTLAYNLTGKPELVLNQAQLADYAASMISSRGGPSEPTYVAHFDSLTGAAIESHVRIAFQAMSLTQGHLNRQGRRT